MQLKVVTGQQSVIDSSELPYYGNFTKSLACGFRQPPPDPISLKGQTGLRSDSVRYDREYVPHHIGEIGIL
jgi:hypothetical protein